MKLEPIIQSEVSQKEKHQTDKGLISKIYKQLLQLNTRKKKAFSPLKKYFAPLKKGP